MDRSSVEDMLIDGYDRLMREGYNKLRLTVLQAQGIKGFDYPLIMVSMTELARKYNHEGQTKRALDVIDAALDTWSVIMRRHQVPNS
jgi:hypothetical protein